MPVSRVRPSLVSVVFTALVALAVAPPGVAGPVEEVRGDAWDRPLDVHHADGIRLEDVFLELGRAVGVTFVFDDGVRRDQRVAVDLTQARAADVLAVLELEAGVFAEPMPGNVLIVAPDNQTKRREYEQQVVRTFVLQNADVKEANALLRGVLEVRRTSVDERSNAITVRDSGARVEHAGDLLAILDRPPGELVIDIELYQVEADALDSAPLHELASRGAARLVAAPSLSARDGDRASLQLADEVGIVTATGDDAPITYHEVGFHLKVRPRLHADAREVTLDVEVSLSGLARAAGGTAGPTLTERGQESTYRVADGESIRMSGLLSTGAELDRPGRRRRAPSVMDVLLGPAEDAGGRELVVVLTPRVTRWPAYEPGDLEPRLIGTDRRVARADR